MKKHFMKQRTTEWFMVRIGICTASEFKNLVTPEFKIRSWSTEMPNTYLAAKLSEKWKGEPDEGYSSFAMEQGEIRENQAIPWYEDVFEVEIERVGFITTDDGRIGASPDGLIGAKRGIEIKVPLPKTHVRYLLKRELPDEYEAQVHGNILVADAEGWAFMSWRPEFPKLVMQVERDEEKCKVLQGALWDFSERFEKAWARLLDMNGGPPPPPPTIEIDEDGTVIKTLAGYSEAVKEQSRKIMESLK